MFTKYNKLKLLGDFELVGYALLNKKDFYSGNAILILLSTIFQMFYSFNSFYVKINLIITV